MHRRTNSTFHIVGLGLLFVSPGMLVAQFVGWGADGFSPYLLMSAVITAGAGLLFWQSVRIDQNITAVTALATVAWTWLACSLAGSLPYLLSGEISWTRADLALFESISGFTATGSTILSDIEAFPRGLLFWRQATQWFGGMGMVVFAVSVLPNVGAGGVRLISAEAPGEADKLAPRVRGTARRLWYVYVLATAAIAGALFLVPGVGLYDAVSHSLTTASTGGFSPYNDSVGHFNSLAVEMIIAAGLLFCSINFALHYRALARGELKKYFKAADQMFFLKMVGVAIAAVSLINWADDLAPFGTALRDSAFSVISLATTGGFGSVRDAGLGNYIIWGAATQAILLGLMIIGGGTGSTSGGLKVFRLYVIRSYIIKSIRGLANPRQVITPKMGRISLKGETIQAVLGFATLFSVIISLGTLAVAALGSDFITSLSGVISAMSNIGPALGEAGPASNFLEFSRPARAILMPLMIVGRLEIIAAILMFTTMYRVIRHK